MDNLNRWSLRFIVFLLVYVGIVSVWEYAENILYGESRITFVNGLVAYIMSHAIDNAIWRKDQ